MLPRLPFAVDTRIVTSFDGTRIAYHATASPFPGAKVILLANGLGGPPASWRAQIDYLSDRYRLITWDYRGMYASDKPPRNEASSYTVPNHVRDLEAIAKAEGVTSAALIGWSMGVQVSLEAYKRLPGLIQSLVLINGTSGRALDTVSPIPGMKVVIPRIVDVARRAHGIAKQLAQRTTSQPETALWFKRMGLISETFDDGVFAELVHEYSGLDMEAFFFNLKAIGTHDAGSVLASIDVPVLVITGDKDAFTPRDLADHMVRTIKGAEMLVVRGGTHYTCVEFPELVNLRIDRFLREHGYVSRSLDLKAIQIDRDPASARPRVLVIDCYDSFTWNIVQALRGLGAACDVALCDAIDPDGVRAHAPDGVLLSPGPCTPTEAGATLAILAELSDDVPILGVCLGHQSIAHAFGGRVVRAARPMHGKTSRIEHDGKSIFEGAPPRFVAARYNSLVVEPTSLPSSLHISAWTEEGEVMGLRHRTRPLEGVQFHPESALSEEGDRLLGNWLAKL